MKNLDKNFGFFMLTIIFRSSLLTYARTANDLTTPPSGFRLNWTDAFTAIIQWDEMDDGAIQGYNVSLCNVMRGCDWPKLINVTTEDQKPRIVIENLEANNLYKARFAAYNSTGTGPWSSPTWSSANPGMFMFSTNTAPPHIAPTKLQVWVKNEAVRVKWEKPEFIVTRVNGYRVEVWRQNESPEEAIRIDSAGMLADEVSFNLTYSDYNIWVRAFNYGGGGKPSKLLAISTEQGKEMRYSGGSGAVYASVLVMTTSLLFWLLVDHSL